MAQDNRTDNMLTVQQVARQLHVHPSTLRRWSNIGRIKAYRITPRGERRYKLQDIARFIAGMNAYYKEEERKPTAVKGS